MQRAFIRGTDGIDNSPHIIPHAAGVEFWRSVGFHNWYGLRNAAPADFFWFPALQTYHSAWTSAVIMCSLLGAIFGGAIGLIAGARHHNRQ